jgi:hypothetical protein
VALLSALASSALTLLLASAFRPVPPRAPDPLTTADFKEALGTLEREVAALRREAAARAEAAEAGVFSPAAEADAAPAEAAVAPSATPPAASRSTGEPVAVVRGPRLAPSAPVGQYQRFRDVMPLRPDGDEDAEGRRRLLRTWMFRSEREVLEWFGVPDSVGAEGEREDWYYEVSTGALDEEGDPVIEDFTVVLNRGRLIRFEE